MAPVPHQQQAPGCKANLYLRITGQREDGYHELESLFLPLQQPSDQIHFEPGAPGSGLTLTCSDPDLATPSNSIRVAYETFRSVSDKAPDLRIHLDKQVPQGAGLGGGSADAACVLQYLHAHVCPGLLNRTSSGSLCRSALMSRSFCTVSRAGSVALANGWSRYRSLLLSGDFWLSVLTSVFQPVGPTAFGMRCSPPFKFSARKT